MKKQIGVFLMIASLYIVNTLPTYAIYCSNCSTNIQQFKDFVRQGLQLAKESATAFSSGATAAATTIDQINNTVLKPMKDAMTLIAILKSGDAIQNLIMGSLGVDPLMVKDPELYLENKALEVVRASVGDVALQYGTNNGDIVKSLINSTKYKYSDTSAKINSINQDTLSSTIKEKTCDDEMLSNLARQDVEVEGEPLDQAAYTERKKYFFDIFCKNDPSKDPVTAEALTQLAKARPGIARWETWLQTTSGQNDFTKLAMTQQVINERVTEVVNQAQNDLNLGEGVKSLTTCTKRASTNIDGQPYSDPESAPCLKYEIKQLGSVLIESYKDAIGAPLDTLISSFGSGAGSLLNSAFTSINLIKGISTALDSSSGGGGGGGTTSQSPWNPGGSSAVTATPVQDLKNNTSVKATLIGPPKKQLNDHLAALNSLETNGKKFISTIDFYKSRLDSLKSCAATLSNYQEAQGSDLLTSINSFLLTQYDQGDTLRKKTIEGGEKIEITKKLITETILKIEGSQSTEEILSFFNAYQDRVESENLPQLTTAATIEAEQTNFISEVEASDSEGGQIYTYKTECTTLIQQIEFRRNYSAP